MLPVVDVDILGLIASLASETPVMFAAELQQLKERPHLAISEQWHGDFGHPWISTPLSYKCHDNSQHYHLKWLPLESCTLFGSPSTRVHIILSKVKINRSFHATRLTAAAGAPSTWFRIWPSRRSSVLQRWPRLNMATPLRPNTCP